MNALQQGFTNLISNAFEEYISNVSSQLNITKSKLIDIWNNMSNDVKLTESSSSQPAPKKTQPKKSSKDEATDVGNCEHVYKKGSNPGSTCGKKVSKESKTGKYCKSHLTNESKSDESVNKKTSVQTTLTSAASSSPVKKTPAKKPTKKEEETPVIKQAQNEAPYVHVKMNKWRNYEHESTGLLFDRKSTEVYGRQNADGTIKSLTQEDIEICKNLGLSYRLPENLSSEKDDDQDEETLVSDEEEELEEEDEELEEDN